MLNISPGKAATRFKVLWDLSNNFIANLLLGLTVRTSKICQHLAKLLAPCLTCSGQLSVVHQTENASN